MAVNEDFLQFVLDQLSDFGEVKAKKMFGGAGLFFDSKMFGMVGKGVFRLKADDVNRPDYEARGMEALGASGGKKIMPYWQVPDDVLEDREELTKWATKAYESALRAAKK